MRPSILAAFAALLAGCATSQPLAIAPERAANGAIAYTAPIRPPQGFFFSSYTAPVTTDFDRTSASPPKFGKASTKFLSIPFFGRWDFAFGDARITDAARNGGIQKVYYADHRFLQVMGIFGLYETIVYGE